MLSYARHLWAAIAFVVLIGVLGLAATSPLQAQDTSDKERIANLEAQVRTLQSLVTNLQAQLINTQSALNIETTARKQGDADTLAAAKAISDRQIEAVADKVAHFTRSGNELYISGANVHIVNGSGKTDTVNGLGNLIVGYNESRTDGSDNRTGSHNLVIGKELNFNGFGGIAAGVRNSAAASAGSPGSRGAAGGSTVTPNSPKPTGNSQTAGRDTADSTDPNGDPGSSAKQNGASGSAPAVKPAPKRSAGHRRTGSRSYAHRRTVHRSSGHKSGGGSKPATHVSGGIGRPPGR